MEVTKKETSKQKTLKLDLLYDIAILLVMYPKTMNSAHQEDICMHKSFSFVHFYLFL
jgi:hypothetical protein